MDDSLELTVCGGTVVLPDGPRRADLGIAGGRIAAIEDDLRREAPEQVDARDLHVLPGVLDAHVHLNEPGRTEWEGFTTGTGALAAGGATAFLDMPLNSSPPTVTAAAFDTKRAAAERAAHIDFGLWGGIVPGNVDELDELAARGVVGFKAFMCDSGIDEFPACGDDDLHDGMARAAALGLPVAVHAESAAAIRELTARAQRAGATGAREFLATRPIAAELEAINRALALARETGCGLHVVHVTCGAGVALVAQSRAEGLDVSCETCPHYLVLAEEDLERLGPVAKCAPPLRSAAERDALWAAIADGTLPMVASDHSPAPPELKMTEDVFSAWGGIAGAQTMLELLLTEGHHARRVSLATIADLTAAFPARRFRLAGKGSIARGADADLVLVALHDAHVLTPADLRMRHPISPFLGRTLRGRVVRTLLRGETVWASGGLRGAPAGRLLIPAPRPSTVQESR